MKKLKEVKFIIVHHSEMLASSIKEIKDFHIKERGWEDIGYHYLIGTKTKLMEEGKLYKGRSEKYQGAHALDFNKNSIGICIIGNFDKKPATKKQIQTLIKFLKEKIREYKIPVKNILGHCELPKVTKSCPGFNINMNEIREKIVF